MKFETYYQRLIYLLGLVTTGALFITEQLHPLLLLLLLMSIGLGYRLDRQQRIVVPPAMQRPLFVVAMGLALADWLYISQNWFIAIAHLMLLVFAIKFLSPKANRDYVQIMALSFFQVLATSILTADALFSIFFVATVVLITMSLSAFAAKAIAEGDDDPVRSELATQQAHLPPARLDTVLRDGMSRMNGLVALVVMAMTVFVFFAFPRIGHGLVGGQLGLAQPQSGFSDSVNLDSFAEIKLDERIAVRVASEDTRPINLPTYLRGVALDTFDGNGWRATLKTQGVPAIHGTVSIDQRFVRHPDLQWYRLLVDDLGTKLMPLLPWPVAISTQTRAISMTQALSIHRPRGFSGAYAVDAAFVPGSYLEANAVGAKLFDAEELSEEITTKLAPFLTVGDGLTEAAADALDDIVELDADANYNQRWRAVMAFGAALNQDFEYVLKPHPEQDPLLDFLQSRQGHCEFFATAMALYARRLGIPARVVNGFAGGSISDIGQYVYFRNSDAHSWVELYHPRFGWVYADPTPPLLDNGVAALWTSLQRRTSELVDLYRFFWLNRVVDYDLSQQTAMFDGLRQETRTLFSAKRSQRKPLSERWKELGSTAKQFAIFVALALLVLGVVLVVRAMRSGPPILVVGDYLPMPTPNRQLARSLDRLGQVHRPRQPNEPLTAFVAEAVAQTPQADQAAILHAKYYEMNRYRQSDPLETARHRRALVRSLDKLRRQMRSAIKKNS